MSDVFGVRWRQHYFPAGLLAAAVLGAGLLLLPAPRLLPAPGLPDVRAVASTRLAEFLLDNGIGEGPAVYRGLGTWVDVYDLPHLGSAGYFPEIKKSGVRTVYLETASAGSARIVHRKRLAKFLERAHDSGIDVVAWTLPGHTNPPDDRHKALAAIRFKSPRGDRFDGFALDIESTSVRDLGRRNRRMLALSRQIKKAANGMPLGAITYPPVTSDGPWNHFPWQEVSRIYDVFLPMAYATYRYDTERGVRAYTIRNVNRLRRNTHAGVPIHMVGGLASGMSAAATRGFVDAVRSTGISGASLYDSRITSGEDWRLLKEIR